MDRITMLLNADKFIKLALEEDISSEDVTTNSVMPDYKKGEVQLICKEDGIIAGDHYCICCYGGAGICRLLWFIPYMGRPWNRIFKYL